MDQGTWNMLGDYNKYEHSHEELELLKAKVNMFWEFLNNPMARQFFLINYVREQFKEEFEGYVN